MQAVWSLNCFALYITVTACDLIKRPAARNQPGIIICPTEGRKSYGAEFLIPRQLSEQNFISLFAPPS